MFIGLRPAENKTRSSEGAVGRVASHLNMWDKFSKITETSFNLPNLITNESTFTASGSVVTPSFVGATATALVATKTIDRLTISAHGIFLYNDMPSEFFHQYTAYTYGGPHVVCPEDQGALMIPFNLYPGSYQPSGHVNVSRAREFYIRYVSSVIGQIENGSAISGELIIVASAISVLVASRELHSKLKQKLRMANSVIASVEINNFHSYNSLVECSA